MRNGVSEMLNYLHANASPHSTGYCARSIRRALRRGGINMVNWPTSAKYYVDFLPTIGFEKVVGEIKPGDIAVISPIPGHEHGHICMWDGEHWISDFVQRDMWGGQSYREIMPNYSIFRMKNENNG